MARRPNRAGRARSLSRKLAMQALYQWQLTGQSAAELRNQYAAEEGFGDADADYFRELLDGITEGAAGLDESLGALIDRAVGQLDPVELWLREVQGEAPSPPPGERVGVRGEAADPQPAGAHRTRYETILDWTQLDAWLQKLDAAPLAAVDTETTSLDPMRARLVGLSFAVADGEAAYLPLAHRYAGVPQQLTFDAALAKLKPWLESPRHAKLGQNLKYDMHVLANHGIRLAGVAHDTLLASYVVESDKSHDMDSLAARHLGIATIKYDEVTGKGAAGMPCPDRGHRRSRSRTPVEGARQAA